MKTFKRAWISVSRKLKKTVILMGIIFILGNVMTGAIFITQAIKNTEESLKKQLPPVAMIELDTEALDRYEDTYGYFPTVEPLTVEHLNQVGKLHYVKYYDILVTANLYSREIIKYIDPIWFEGDMDPIPPYIIEGLAWFYFKGVQHPEIIDIQERLIQLVDGRVFTEEEVHSTNPYQSVALISQNLAQSNNLTVGSIITIENNIYNSLEDSEVEYEVLYSDHNRYAFETYELEVVVFSK